MNCKFVENSLSDYLAGDLLADQVVELEAHLQGCGGCQALVHDFQKMAIECRALPDFPAEKELWHLIREKLTASPPREGRAGNQATEAARRLQQLQSTLRLYKRMVFATAAVALVSFSLLLSTYLSQSQSRTAEQAGGIPVELAALEIRRAELHYERAIESLMQILQEMKLGWNVEMRHVIEQNLKTIDRSIDESKEILQRDPQNLDAGTYLLAVYGRKVDFLKSVVDQPSIS